MITKYTYDAAGRMVREGKRTYRYGYLDKVISVTEGKERITYGYHVDGQLATVTKGKVTENFTWAGLALVKRGITSYLNEPHPGGGAPVASSNGGVMFNDILGTTLGVSANDGYAPSSMTAFGDTINCLLSTSNFFTGKPHVDGLGHAFLLRNYRADLGKWPTAYPLGYPDGWNQMAYCGNRVVNSVDYLGGCILPIMEGWEYVGEASLPSFTNDPEEPIWNIGSSQSDVHSILGRLESLNDMTVTIRISERVTMSEYKEQYTSGGSRGDWEYYYQYCRKYDYLEKRWDMDIVMGNSFIDNLSDFATVFGGVDALCRVLVEASIIPASVAAGASIASLTLYLNQNITSGEMKTINIATRLGERETNDWHRHIWKRRIGEIAKISE